jgi:lincosamide nucleotidyltransferase
MSGLPQHELIDRVRAACVGDAGLVAALMYGSFAHGDADVHSDIEFWLFYEGHAREQLDVDAWIERIADVYATVVGDSGAYVAVFRPSLIRGEFHFAAASTIDQIRSWAALGVTPANVNAMVLVDRDGRLRGALTHLINAPAAPTGTEQAKALCEGFIDWHVFALSVLARGEIARAHMLLGVLHTYLARMARLRYDQTKHWATPTKAFERDLSPAAQERYQQCTSPAERQQLAEALQATWDWGRELVTFLADRDDFTVSEDLLAAVSRRTRSLTSTHQ